MASAPKWNRLPCAVSNHGAAPSFETRLRRSSGCGRMTNRYNFLIAAWVMMSRNIGTSLATRAM